MRVSITDPGMTLVHSSTDHLRPGRYTRSREVKDTGKQTVKGSDYDHEDSDGGGDGHSDEDLDFHVHYHGSSGGPKAHEASGSGGSAGPNALLQLVAQRMQMWVQPCLQLPMCR